MATDTVSRDAAAQNSYSLENGTTGRGTGSGRAFAALASLKLTVVLFSFAIFIILAGTFAQVNQDIWQVVREYFRIDMHRFVNGDFPWFHLGAAFVWIDFQLFFPPSFFPSHPVVPGGFYFPKGWAIGLLLGANLLAAHLVRFRVQAGGTRLTLGLAVTAVGIAITWLVIASGASPNGIQDSARSEPVDAMDAHEIRARSRLGRRNRVCHSLGGTSQDCNALFPSWSWHSSAV